MFRTPKSHIHYGFVVKGSDDNIAVLIKLEDELSCLLCDQIERREIAKGLVSMVEIDLVTDDGKFILDQTGLHKQV
jgi:hypothetical protein